MAGGIPSQIKRLNERIDEIERSQADLQRVIDDEVLPATKRAAAKAEAALEVAAKVSRRSDRRRK